MDVRNPQPSEATATSVLPSTGQATMPQPAPSAPVPARAALPDWVDEARGALTLPGRFLAYEESGRHVVVPLSRDWTRIGRSLGAEIRFDDATVSRRHALVALEPDGGTRLLDDRSLNGVHVNGARVVRIGLYDGDVIAVGRHLLYFIDTATVGAPMPPSAASPE